MKTLLRDTLALAALVVCLSTRAATPTVVISGPSVSGAIGTVTVVDATPPSPWYQRAEILGLLGPAVTLAVGLLAAFLAFRQIDKQRRNTLDVQTEKARNEFKLEIYREFCKKLDPTQDGLSSLSLYVVNAADEANNAAYMSSQGYVPMPLKLGGQAFNEKFSEGGLHVSEVIMMIERYLVVEPDLDVFRLALNSAMHELRQQHVEIMKILFKWFPMRRAAGSTTGPEIVNVHIPPMPVIDDLRKRGWEFHGQMGTLTSYLDDLRRELQIHLLSDLFKGEVPARKPLDPSQKVVTLDKAKLSSLRKHFLEDTPWGKHSAALEKEVAESFKQGAVPASPKEEPNS